MDSTILRWKKYQNFEMLQVILEYYFKQILRVLYILLLLMYETDHIQNIDKLLFVIII